MSVGEASVRDPGHAGGLVGLYPDTVPDKVFSDWGEVTITATGDIKDDTCGTFRAKAACSADISHGVITIPNTCGRPVCPVCWPTWARREAERVASRVDGYRQAVRDQAELIPGVKRVYSARHHMISPPASVVNGIIEKVERRIMKKGGDFWPLFIDRLREESYQVLEASGLQGAAVVIHIYRIRPEHQDHIKEEVEQYPDLYKDRWQFVIKQPDWQKYVYFSPHIHLVSYGWSIPSREFHEDTGGWSIRMIRQADSTAGLVYYLLSHVGHIPGKNAVTYWGCVSTRKLRMVESITVREDVECEKCGAIMVYCRVDDKGEILGLTDSPLRRRKVVRRYILRRDHLVSDWGDLHAQLPEKASRIDKPDTRYTMRHVEGLESSGWEVVQVKARR